MKSEYPFNPLLVKKEELPAASPSRFIDEKISDDVCAEAHTESALAPAGLKNPFWN